MELNQESNCNQQQLSTEVKDLQMKLHNSIAKVPRDVVKNIPRTDWPRE